MEDGTVRHAPNAFPITEQDADVEVRLKMKVTLNPPSEYTGARPSFLRINMYGSTEPADRLWIPDSLLGTTQHTAQRAGNVGEKDYLRVFNSNLSNTVLKLNKNTKYPTRCSGIYSSPELAEGTLLDDDDPLSVVYMPTCYPRSSGIRCDGYLKHDNESVPHEHSDYRTDPECFTHPVCSKVNAACEDGGIEARRAIFTLYDNTGYDGSPPMNLGAADRGYPSSMSKPYCGLLGHLSWDIADSSVVNPNYKTRHDLDLSDGYMDVVFRFDMANKRMIVEDAKTQVQLCDQPLHSTYRDAVFDMTKIDAMGIETNLDTVEIATFRVSKTVGSSPSVSSQSGSLPPSSPPPPYVPKNDFPVGYKYKSTFSPEFEKKAMFLGAKPNEPVTMDQLRAMRKWSLPFPAGTADPQESDGGAAFLAILLPLLGGDDAPFEVASCDWMSVDTEFNFRFKCSDGSYCDGFEDGFGCCGANERIQCPKQLPFMCNSKTCGNGHHCCESSCEEHGGYRACEA